MGSGSARADAATAALPPRHRRPATATAALILAALPPPCCRPLAAAAPRRRLRLGSAAALATSASELIPERALTAREVVVVLQRSRGTSGSPLTQILLSCFHDYGFRV